MAATLAPSVPISAAPRNSALAETICPEPSVSVVVCAYTESRWAELRQAMASLAHQRRPPLEVILVVDHCRPLERRARRCFHEAVVVPNQHERGLSGARNTGVERSTGAVVAFLDDDAVASAGWLEHLADAYQDPDVQGAGGLVHARWIDGRPSWFPREFDWVVGCSYRGLPDGPAPIRNPIGANMSFRREVFDAIGGFRSGLGRVGAVPLGCEETELCLRVADHFDGARIMHEPAAVVWHQVPPERATWRYFLSRCVAEGRSKAAVADLAGSAPALESERRYLRKSLPAGVLRALADGIVSPGRLRAAPMILAGVVATVFGYATGPNPSSLAEGLAGSPDKPISEPREAGGHAGVALRTAALGLVVALWAVSLPHVALEHMNDWGLLSVLPITFWLALAVLTVSFCTALGAARTPRWLLAAHVLTFIAILHATPAILYGTLRYAWAWKHVGVVDYVLRHHSSYVGGGFTAYQGWPGFFTLNGVLTGGSGFGSALTYASWAPVVFNLLDLVPLLMILRTFTADRRHTWMAVWIYYLLNWVGQDYFSPQAGAYFLYLTLIALCFRFLLDPRTEGRVVTNRGGRITALPRRHVPTRRVAHAVALVLVLAIVSSHQLTPYMLIASLAALFVTRARRTGLLTVAATVLAVAWAGLFGRAFLSENPWVLSSIGSFFSNASTGLNSLSPRPSQPQMLLAWVDRLLVAAAWSLALVGLWRRRRSWRRDLPLALLAITPVVLLVGNDYGGEMLLRVNLFSLVPIAFFAARALLPPRQGSRPSWAMPVMTLLVAVMLVGFTFAYYGKERANRFTHREVAAAKWLSDRPAGTLVSGLVPNLPWAFHNYERFQYDWMTEETPNQQRRLLAHPARYLASHFSQSGYRDAYLVFTKSQAADIEMTGLLPAHAPQRIERSVLRSPQFDVAFQNRDAVILRYVGPG